MHHIFPLTHFQKMRELTQMVARRDEIHRSYGGHIVT